MWKRVIVFTIFLMFTLLLCQMSLIALTGIQRVPNRDAWMYKGFRCEVEYYPSKQIIALFCPGIDVVRLWPLPIEQPWNEGE